MIGLRWWIMIWYGILALGVVGLVMAINWGRQVKWRNIDEILRGIGTIAALIAFVLAFILGREQERRETRTSDDE
jgi:hypothetical protein